MSHLERSSPYMGCVLLEVVMEEMTSLLEFSRHNDSNPRGRTASQTSYISKHREPVICHITEIQTHMFIHTYTGIDTHNMYTHVHAHRLFHTYTHMCIHTCMGMHVQIHPLYTHTHTLVRACANTHTCTCHRHTYMCIFHTLSFLPGISVPFISPPSSFPLLG